MEKQTYQMWLAAGIVGTMVAFIPMLIVFTIFTGLGFAIFEGFGAILLALACGSFGGVFAYHKMTFGGNRW